MSPASTQSANRNRTYAGPPNVKLWTLRVNAGMGRNELARLAKTSRKSIMDIERGHIPGPEIQRNIARVFHLESLDLFPREFQLDI